MQPSSDLHNGTSDHVVARASGRCGAHRAPRGEQRHALDVVGMREQVVRPQLGQLVTRARGRSARRGRAPPGHRPRTPPRAATGPMTPSPPAGPAPARGGSSTTRSTARQRGLASARATSDVDHRHGGQVAQALRRGRGRDRRIGLHDGDPPGRRPACGASAAANRPDPAVEVPGPLARPRAAAAPPRRRPACRRRPGAPARRPRPAGASPARPRARAPGPGRRPASRRPCPRRPSTAVSPSAPATTSTRVQVGPRPAEHVASRAPPGGRSGTGPPAPPRASGA